MISTLINILFFTLLILPASLTQAQDRHWIFFIDKEGVEFDPYTYFDNKVIERRTAMNVPLFDDADLPVRKDYIEAIKNISGEIHTVSRWFNAVSVSTREKNITEILQLPFVVGTSRVTMKAKTTEKRPFNPDVNLNLEHLRSRQLESMGAHFFEENRIDGKGIRIAIFDGGFTGVDISPMFNHLRENNQIIATWDFVRNREYVYSYNSHGTSVLTCIAGKLDDKKFGLAAGAEFLLARTEISREAFSEEENWVAALEWAEKNGADIINSSLGYTHHRYYQQQMDGRSSLVSRAATIAAAKGILVVNAAGNDGSGFWQVIGAPADADSILSVGGVSPYQGYIINFSSIGPTHDGRLKPNVCAFGEVATSDAKKVKKAFGTSFSSPLVAGFSACVMQIYPDWHSMKVYDEIQKSGHLFPYYDYAHGYGVPQAAYFTGQKEEPEATFFFSEDNDSIRIVLISKEYLEKNDYQDSTEADFPNGYPSPDSNNDNNSSKNNTTNDNGHYTNTNSDTTTNSKRNAPPPMTRYNIDDKYLYFHVESHKKEILKRYAVVKIKPDTNFFSLSKEEMEGNVLRVFYKGYVNEFNCRDSSRAVPPEDTKI